MCYYEGSGGAEQNDQQAFYWLDQAAEGGHIAAQYGAGLCWAAGVGTRQDFDKAAELYLAAADQMVRHGAALMAETDYVLDVKELRSRAPKAFLLLLGCDGENALPAFDDYGRGALLGDDTLQYADADAIQAAVRQLKQLVTVL